jgi:hypothetical protein
MNLGNPIRTFLRAMAGVLRLLPIPAAVVLTILLVCSGGASAYSVLTHEEMEWNCDLVHHHALIAAWLTQYGMPCGYDGHLKTAQQLQNMPATENSVLVLQAQPSMLLKFRKSAACRYEDKLLSDSSNRTRSG